MRYAALGCVFIISCATAGEHPPAPPPGCGAGQVHAANTLQADADGRIEVLQIRAVLSGDGTEVHRKHALDWKRRTRPQSIPLSDGSLCLRVHFSHGPPLEVPFDAYVEGDATDSPKLFGGFTLEIPVPDNRKVERVDVARKGKEALITWTEGEIPIRP